MLLQFLLDCGTCREFPRTLDSLRSLGNILKQCQTSPGPVPELISASICADHWPITAHISSQALKLQLLPRKVRLASQLILCLLIWIQNSPRGFRTVFKTSEQSSKLCRVDLDFIAFRMHKECAFRLHWEYGVSVVQGHASDGVI